MPGRGTETITVKRLDHRDYERWDRFVQDQPTASFFHRAGWRDVAERAFGHQTHYLYAESLGNITGILPLARWKKLAVGVTARERWRLPACRFLLSSLGA